MNKSVTYWKLIAIGLVVLTLLILFPFFGDINVNGITGLLNNGSFINTLQKTLLNAFVSSIILATFGFGCALILLKIPTFSLVGKNLAVLILPIILGNISIAFICKLVWGDSSLFSYLAQGNPLNKLVFLVVLNLYQFGLLFVYLFWMQLQNISVEKNNFAVANQFSLYQKLKDIYLPHSRNLWLLLTAIGFVFTFYEESKITYLFKVSQGTNSELITNWLNRNYQTNLLVNPNYANRLAFDTSTVVLLTAIIGVIILLLAIYYVIKQSTALKYYPNQKSIQYNHSSFEKAAIFAGATLSAIAILPLIATLFKISLGLNFSVLGFPLLMTFLATLAASATAIIFGIASRLGWKVTLSSFNQKSLPFFVLLFVLLLVPPIVILITGYQWMALIGYTSLSVIYIIWIIGHVLLTLPVLGSFVLFNHFRVSILEIDYLRVYRLSTKETIWFSFFSRFKAEYILLFIIGYSFIWNEAVLNNLFSDYIPSFVSGMKMLITGRGADYDKAFGYLFVSFTLAIASVIIWRFIIEKAPNQLNTEA